MQVISLANSPRSDATQLASLIARDPMLSARVLQAANSAAYTSNGGMVTTIPDAIRKIGSTSVRNIATALGVFDVMPESSADGFNPISCWQHSFAVAQLCEQLARQKEPDTAGTAYVVGLCHDLSEIFVHTQFRAEYQQVLDLTKRTGRPQDELEREMLGMTHAELVKTIFTCVGLPDEIREPVEILHGPKPDKSNNALASILWIAENYANGSLLASGPTSQIAALPQTLCKAATGSPNPPRPDAGSLRSEVVCMTAMLARLSKGDEAKLMAPVFQRRPINLWLARDPGLSLFDPVETALSCLAQVHVYNRLPAGKGEGDDVQGLVILSASPDAPGFKPSDVEYLLNQRSRAGQTLPLLWMSGGRRLPADAKVAPLQLPVPLTDLAAFVEAIASAGTPSSAAA
jgi:HD-like signal output (HDOD) protein